MHTENQIVIRAGVDRIYRLAAMVEHWPLVLPHYRWVRVLLDGGNERLVEMAAHRDGFPVQWRAIQVCEPSRPAITFRHVGGITRGMEVEWRFETTSAGVRVSILHDLRLGWPLVGGLVADWVIGPVFVANIAGKTLSRIKELAEIEETTALDATAAMESFVTLPPAVELERGTDGW